MFGGVPYNHRHIPSIAALRGISQQSFQPGQVCGKRQTAKKLNMVLALANLILADRPYLAA